MLPTISTYFPIMQLLTGSWLQIPSQTILVLMAKEAMTSKELPSLQKQFRSCDIDGDGMISQQDMSLNMKRRGSLSSDTDACQLVERLCSVSSDKGGSREKMLSFEQFVIGEIHLRAQVRGKK